jgi:hypothetical protein
MCWKCWQAGKYDDVLNQKQLVAVKVLEDSIK